MPCAGPTLLRIKTDRSFWPPSSISPTCRRTTGWLITTTRSTSRAATLTTRAGLTRSTSTGMSTRPSTTAQVTPPGHPPTGCRCTTEPDTGRWIWWITIPRTSRQAQPHILGCSPPRDLNPRSSSPRPPSDRAPRCTRVITASVCAISCFSRTGWSGANKTSSSSALTLPMKMPEIPSTHTLPRCASRKPRNPTSSTRMTTGTTGSMWVNTTPECRNWAIRPWCSTPIQVHSPSIETKLLPGC